MKMNNSRNIEEQTKKLGLKFLAEIPYDPEIESAIGNKTKLLATTLARKVKEIVEGNHF
jgi:MinD superfamily P-loop ATPase